MSLSLSLSLAGRQRQRFCWSQTEETKIIQRRPVGAPGEKRGHRARKENLTKSKSQFWVIIPNYHPSRFRSLNVMQIRNFSFADFGFMRHKYFPHIASANLAAHFHIITIPQPEKVPALKNVIFNFHLPYGALVGLLCVTHWIMMPQTHSLINMQIDL